MYMRNGNHWLLYKQGVQGDRKDSCCRVMAASIYMQMALFTFLGCIQQGMEYQGLVGLEHCLPPRYWILSWAL